jgi:hypothetical protein
MPPERYSEGEHIRAELREAATILPELGAYVSLSGRERHRLAPDKFTSKGRLLSSLRPKGLETTTSCCEPSKINHSSANTSR